MKKIGITGGSGFIGQHFLKEYSERFKFIVAIRQKKETDTYYKHLNVDYIEIDFSKASFLEVFLGCEAIIHLAAKRPTSNNEDSFINYLDNIKIAETLFNSCTELHIRNIVNISSRSVYDEDESSNLHKESESAKPYSYYGVAKLCVENMAGIYNRKYGMKIKSLRLGQVLGLGERKSMQTVFLERALTNETIEVFGDGSREYEFIYIKDVCRAILNSIHFAEKSGVFNISSGERNTLSEIAELYCNVFASKAGYSINLDKKDSSFSPKLDITLARDELGFVPKYKLVDALNDIKGQLE